MNITTFCKGKNVLFLVRDRQDFKELTEGFEKERGENGGQWYYQISSCSVHEYRPTHDVVITSPNFQHMEFLPKMLIGYEEV